MAHSTETAPISVLNLTKTFPAKNMFLRMLGNPAIPDGSTVLRDVCLEIVPGELFGLLGSNGAGKTTLLEILATLLLPSRGTVRVCGFDVIREAAQVRNSVGYCPAASDSFYPRLTGWENLQFFALLNDLPASEAKQKISWALDLVGMNGAGTVSFQRLSQGMKQRLAMARALLNDPPVLLLDEPTRSLDPLLQADLLQFLRRDLAEKLGKTIVMATHSLAEAESICNRIAILKDGCIVAVGTPEEINKRLGAPDLAAAFRKALQVGSRTEFPEEV